MLTAYLFSVSGSARAICRSIACAVLFAVVFLFIQPQSMYAQDPGVSEPARQIAAQYGVDPALVQQMINSGIPVELIDLAMIQEYAQPAPSAEPPAANGANLPELAPAQVLTQEVVLESCGSQSFPFVFLNISVKDNGQPVTNLAQGNFSCSENGFTQADSFLVTPPQTGGGVRLADIVFLIDTSGSMGDKIAAVRQNVSAFAQSLQSSSVDFRLGLIQFGNTSGPNPGLFNDGNLTGDVALFTSYIDTLQATGSFEPGFLALRMAVQSFNFRPGAQKVFLLISDEDSDDRNKQSTLDLLQANSVTVHTAVDCASGSSQSDYCDAGSVRGVTQGAQFNIAGPYDKVLDEISTRTASTYVVQYRSSNLNYDGVVRNVVCSVTTAARTDSVACSYIPGAEPKITLTQATLALNNTSLAEGSKPSIEVRVTDVVTPGVKSVTLFYRTSNSNTGYKSILMKLSGTDLYTATVPAVSRPGLDYYIRASDGQVTSQLPSSDPGQRPFQIAVLPNVKPAITHEPIAVAPAGVALSVAAVVEDKTNRLVSAELKWKYAGELIYRTLAMSAIGGSQYSAAIAQEQMTRDINYYIVATDDLGVAGSSGSADNPHTIKVADYSGMTISLSVADIVHFGENARVTARVVRNGSTKNAVKVGFEVLAGPNQGLTEGKGLCITVFGWKPCVTSDTGELLWKYKYNGSKGIGKDEVRAYVDINRNDRYDKGEPVATDKFGWYEHVSYVALGDSYSSGEGLGGYIDNTDQWFGNSCHRSEYAYPRLLTPYPYDKKISDGKGPTIDFFACSGAKTGNILGNMTELNLKETGDDEDASSSGPLERVNDQKVQNVYLVEKETQRGIELITISIGGNDTDWPAILKFCLDKDNCPEINYMDTQTKTTDYIEQRIKIAVARVRVTVAELKKTAPQAALFLIGYPIPFPSEKSRQECAELANPLKTLFYKNDKWSPEEQNRILRAANDLNDKLRAVAAELGIHFIDPRAAFAGHEICGEKERYINQLDANYLKFAPKDEALHPNAKGHEAYQKAIEAYLKQQIIDGAPLNRAGMPLTPINKVTNIPPQEPAVALSVEQLAVADSVRVTGLNAQPADPLCGAFYGSLAGGRVNAAGSGFAAGTAITLTLQVSGLEDMTLAPAIADVNGNFEATITLPAVTLNTAYRIIAIGASPGGNTIYALSQLLPLFAQQPPCTSIDTVATSIDTPVRIDVLANDNAGPAALDPASLVVRVQPNNGTARVDVATRSLIYEPDLGFFGEDSITYGICDQSGTCAEGLVNIAVNAGCTITGTEDDDVLVGTNGADVICGYGGDDVLDGGEGNDILLGGSGHDALYGGPGDDRVFGDTGENVASGGDGVDLVVPGDSALMSDVSEIRAPQRINSLLLLTATAASHDPAAALYAPFGSYVLTATFTNASAQVVTNPFFKVTTLSQNNVLLGADGGPSGEGGRLSIPAASLGANGILDPGESFAVTFVVGVVSPSVFDFAIDAYGTVESGETLVGGESESFRFAIGEESLNFIKPLYLPVIVR